MNTRRMLILDDDPDICQMIMTIAESTGIEAKYVTESSGFFRMVEEWRPSDIAIDLIMPDMDGVQVLARLAEIYNHARVIITSGVGDRVLQAAARSAAEHGLEIVGVLSKPFSPKQLRGMLGEQSQRVRISVPRPAARVAEDIPVAELEQAIADRQLYLMYQPKIRCADNQMDGFEALVRWRHPVRGMVPPDSFIPLAETCGLIGPITDYVLEMAIAWFAENFRAEQLCIAVNLSARSVIENSTDELSVRNDSLSRLPSFSERIDAICRECGLAPSQLILELTETSAMEDPVASLDLLTRLRMKNFQLSIDDFGTGYSSMVQLVRLPFSELKVDRSFVHTAMHSQESRTVIRSIVDLGHNLGMRVTAEGVEDADTLQYLREVGCDLAQGYYISAPMTGEAALDWVARYRPAALVL